MKTHIFLIKKIWIYTKTIINIGLNNFSGLKEENIVLWNACATIGRPNYIVAGLPILFAYRIEKEEYEHILKNKTFDIVYDKIIADRIKHNEGLMNIGLSNFREAIKCLNFAEVEKTFKLIKDQNYSVFVQLDIPVIIPKKDVFGFSFIILQNSSPSIPGIITSETIMSHTSLSRCRSASSALSTVTTL